MQDYYDVRDTDQTQDDLINDIHHIMGTSDQSDYMHEKDHHSQPYHDDEQYEEEVLTEEERVDYERYSHYQQYQQYQKQQLQHQQYYQQEQQEQQFHNQDVDQYEEEEIQEQQEEEEENEEDYVYERPILVESDSDDQDEEEVTTPDPFSGLPSHQPALCYHCSQPLSYQEQQQGCNTLTVEPTPPLCSSCAIINAKQKKPKKRRSLSFSSDGLFGQVAGKIKQSVNFLSPSKSMDRRKSMSSLEIPPISTTPIDANGGLGISRPSSRASSIIEDVKHFLSPIQGALSRKSSRTSLLDDDVVKGPQRKSSHTSLLDAFNLCKPKPKQQSAFERRGLVDYMPEGGDEQDTFQLLDIEPYVPLRRKQIREVDALWERVEVYNRAYADCMESQTNMLPWIVKQSQKGPPDAYFGYIPPAREPKKILGVFKVKPKVREELPQQKLGIDISRISTPLHHQTSRNSVLSPNEYLSKPNESDTALEKPNAPIQQPVSILKKTKSNPNYNDDYMNAPIVEDDGESYRQYRRPIMHRSSRSSLYSQRTMTPQHYPEDFYYRPRGYYYDPRDDYRDEYRDNDRHRYDDVEEYDSQDEEVERRGYYGTTMKMTPLRMEEWENALDTLCDEFPRLDRMYLNDFLRSTRGDFISAKNMVLEMIMENRRPLF